MDATHFLSAGIVSFARGLNDTPKIAAMLLVVRRWTSDGARRHCRRYRDRRPPERRQGGGDDEPQDYRAESGSRARGESLDRSSRDLGEHIRAPGFDDARVSWIALRDRVDCQKSQREVVLGIVLSWLLTLPSPRSSVGSSTGWSERPAPSKDPRTKTPISRRHTDGSDCDRTSGRWRQRSERFAWLRPLRAYTASTGRFTSCRYKSSDPASSRHENALRQPVRCVSRRRRRAGTSATHAIRSCNHQTAAAAPVSTPLATIQPRRLSQRHLDDEQRDAQRGAAVCVRADVRRAGRRGPTGSNCARRATRSWPGRPPGRAARARAGADAEAAGRSAESHHP